ncbi:unnamed protein product [Arctogadus glacialis]
MIHCLTYWEAVQQLKAQFIPPPVLSHFPKPTGPCQHVLLQQPMQRARSWRTGSRLSFPEMRRFGRGWRGAAVPPPRLFGVEDDSQLSGRTDSTPGTKNTRLQLLRRGVDPDGTSYWRTSLTPGGLLWLCHERLRVCQSCGPAERVWGPDGPQRARVAGPTDAEGGPPIAPKASTTRPPSRTPAAVLRTDGATGQMTDLHLGVH